MIPRQSRLMILLLLAACAAGPFLGTVHHDFVNYDDPLYITENPHVRQGLTLGGVKWAFTRTYAGNWQPLTWLSHMLDVSLFGLNPGGHHLVNLVWHVLNTLLLYLVLFRMTGARRASILVACLFALHPAHVESVAWISERKDLVSTFLGLACIGAYIPYARNPSPGRYMIVLVLLALGLMAKPMLVTWPCLLLLLDFWPLNRLQGLLEKGSVFGKMRRNAWIVAEKLPLLLLSAASSVITIRSHHQIGAIGTLDAYPLSERLLNAMVAYGGYLERMAWPFDLVVFYPPLESATLVGALPALLLIAGGTLFALHSVRRRPYLLVGWLWYLGTLVPVIGLVRQGSQSMPDHFTYVSYIGVFIALVWAMEDAVHRSPGLARTRSAGISAVLLLLMVNAWIQASCWSDSIALFRRNLALYPENAVAHHNLALALDEQGRTEDAIRHYRQALAVSPESAKTLNNLGVALARSGGREEALSVFARALAVNPSHAAAHKNIALLLNAGGDNEAAMDHLQRAMTILKEAQTDAWTASGESRVVEQAEIEFHTGRIAVEMGRVDRGVAAHRRLETDRPELAARLAVAVACHYHQAGDAMQALVWGAKARHHALFDPDLLKSEAGMDRLCRSRVWMRP